VRRVLLACLLFSVAGGVLRGHDDALDKAFEAYWNADDARAASKAADRILKAGVDFDAVWTRLKAGRPYKHEKTGELVWRYPAPPDAAFENRIQIPASYDPARAWPVRVQLHGGVNRPPPGAQADARGSGRGRGGGGANRIAGEDQIYVLPSGWDEAAWWHTNQIENILRVLDRLKRQYNVDESHVYLTGISDGGTGVYYMALRETTPWSAFLPLNGSIVVLGNPSIRADGNLHLSNLTNKPFFIVNGGRDPLYPVTHVQTHIDVFKRIGVPLEYRPQPDAGHDTSWWPAERAHFEEFVRSHPRVPHPDQVSWETERTDRFNRAHWLVIDKLGAAASDVDLEDLNFLPHPRRSGRADVRRHGNRIDARTHGVAELTLLLSPEVFDFTKPITVTVNGREVSNADVTRDPAVLFKWAAIDNDRTMLYGAELKIRVP
jgi:poly(3-hydroxybutyrate) depolymerase